VARSCVGSPSQLDVSGADDLKSASVALQTKRAIGVDAVERTRHGFVGAGMNGEWSSDRMGARKPGLGEQCRRTFAPQAEQTREAGRQKGGETLGLCLAAEGCCFPAG